MTVATLGRDVSGPSFYSDVRTTAPSPPAEEYAATATDASATTAEAEMTVPITRTSTAPWRVRPRVMGNASQANAGASQAIMARSVSRAAQAGARMALPAQGVASA